MRWLAVLFVTLLATPAGARMFRCTDGFVPIAQRFARYGDCDGDGIINGVCSFRGRNRDAVITVKLNGHGRARRTVGQDSFVCRAARSEGPVIIQYADPCGETCTFNLCVTAGVVERCPD